MLDGPWCVGLTCCGTTGGRTKLAHTPGGLCVSLCLACPSFHPSNSLYFLFLRHCVCLPHFPLVERTTKKKNEACSGLRDTHLCHQLALHLVRPRRKSCAKVLELVYDVPELVFRGFWVQIPWLPSSHLRRERTCLDPMLPSVTGELVMTR